MKQTEYNNHQSLKVYNNANLWDLIAATSLVVLYKLDPNHWLFVLCYL